MMLGTQRHGLGYRCYHSIHCKTTNATITVAPPWCANLTPAPVNSSWPVGAADCIPLDELFDDGKAMVELEAAATWLVEVAFAAPRLDVATKTEVEASVWPVVCVVPDMIAGEDSNDEADAEVSAGADAEEAPAEGLNVAVIPQSSAAAPTWSP